MWKWKRRSPDLAAAQPDENDRTKARRLVEGADEYVRLVGREVRRYAITALILTAGLVILVLVSYFGDRMGGDTKAVVATLGRPTSTDNILTAYTLLGALLFALQVGVRSLNKDGDFLSQIEPAEVGRRRMVRALASASGIASFGVTILCYYWFIRPDQQVDLFRTLGPVGASIVLAVVAAETAVAADLPNDPRLREALEKRSIREATHAYVRLPRRTLKYPHTRLLVLIIFASAVPWGAWLFALGRPEPGVMFAAGMLSALAAAASCWALISISTAIAQQQILESVFQITMLILGLAIYTLTGWVAFAPALDSHSWAPILTSGVASALLFFGPAVLMVLISLRSSSTGKPGVIVAFASRKLGKTRDRVKQATTKIEKASDEARRRRRRRLYFTWALVLSILPALPQVLIRVGCAGNKEGEYKALATSALWTSGLLSIGYVVTFYVLTAVHRV